MKIFKLIEETNKFDENIKISIIIILFKDLLMI